MSRLGSFRGTVGVIGAGRFGLALTETIARHGHDVLLFTSLGERARELQESRRLPAIVPELDRLHPKAGVTTDPRAFADGCSLMLLTVSSEYFSPVMEPLGACLDGAHQVVHAFHSLDGSGLQPVSERIKNLSCVLQVGVMAGPMHVSELLEGKPNAVVVGSAFPGIRDAIGKVLGAGHIQVYGTSDLRGVEYAAALGQVVAILIGLADGLDLGASSHAALLTRGLREIASLGVELGAREGTFHGLAGLGRLVDAVRRNEPNYAFGLELARTTSVHERLQCVPPEVQGVDVARHVDAWCRQHGAQVPVVQALARILQGDDPPRESLLALMQHDAALVA